MKVTNAKYDKQVYDFTWSFFNSTIIIAKDIFTAIKKYEKINDVSESFYKPTSIKLIGYKKMYIHTIERLIFFTQFIIRRSAKYFK